MSVVFRFAKDGESKNPIIIEFLGLPCRGKVLSFAYFSLHEQRKVGRALARKPLIFCAARSTFASRFRLQKSAIAVGKM
jgi:hypothetical protein